MKNLNEDRDKPLQCRYAKVAFRLSGIFLRRKLGSTVEIQSNALISLLWMRPITSITVLIIIIYHVRSYRTSYLTGC